MIVNKDLIQHIDLSIKNVYEKHPYLIKHQVHERSIVFWFGVYFYELLQDTEFFSYDLDFEYNKDHSNKKKTKNFPKGTYPDILLHKRGSNEDNLLIIEFKTGWSRKPIKRDLEKLADFTSRKHKYKYKLGISIVLYKKRPPKFTYVIDGKIKEGAYE